MTFMVPTKVPDGTYQGVWSAHKLKFRLNRKNIDCTTERGVRGIDVPVKFRVKNGELVESSIQVLRTDEE